MAVAVAGLLVAWQVGVALRTGWAYDIGLALRGGQLAWETGRPEDLRTWISTPFLAAVMALVSRVTTKSGAAVGMTLLNGVVIVTLLAVTWRRLRRELGPIPWSLSLMAAAGFAPIVSSLWWKQLNIVALALAILGERLAQTRRPVAAGASTALSLAIKPILVLVPVAMLLRRDARRAGWWTLAWGGAALGLSQVFLAWRAGDAAALSPLNAVRNFAHKSRPENLWGCHAENFSPQSTLCRLAGPESLDTGRLVVTGGVLVLAVVVLHVVRRAEPASPTDGWLPFAFAAALSPLFSPIAWAHYQLVLAPLLVLLVCRLAAQRAPVAWWLALLAAFALTQLMWRPPGSLPGAVRELLTGQPETKEQRFAVASVATVGQYAVIMTALATFRPRRPTPALEGPSPPDAAGRA
ncbi:MAG TPA: glycosyltransferase family 87 protein [Acidimicrobiales bacterium]|nr:glycosyltransferase family 87 protein [Acidimicrobiales bacterium]